MKNRFALPLAALATLTGLCVYGAQITETCVPGNPDYEAGTGLCTAKNRASSPEAKAKAKAEKVKRDQEWEARKKELAEKAKAEAEAKRQAEAKIKAEGWFLVSPGVYARWCTQTCSNADVIGDASYWLLEVWAKDRAAGDIYAQVNVLENDVVIGWTNDTAYLSKGQKGVMTFSKYLPGSGYTAQLVKFNARG